MLRWGVVGASTIAKEWVINAIRSSGGQIAGIVFLMRRAVKCSLNR